MQAIFETLFDIIYLSTVITLGIRMLRRAGGRNEVLLLGVMSVVLGCGDAFHLVPRAYALCTDGLAAHAAALGFGKLVTSVTMTVFYVLLYHVAKQRYRLRSQGLSVLVYLLAAVRIALCLFPQNAWLSPNPPLSWGVARNIPFALLGLLIIVLFFQKGRADRPFRHMWLAVSLSFAFYIPVVLWADAVPLMGMLMIPKTCAYVWIVWMGWTAVRQETAH